MSEKHYMTKTSYEALRTRLKEILSIERPQITAVVRWAAGNGDRSENADYIYGKRKLRELDKEAYRLQKKLDSAIVIDMSTEKHHEYIFFGATVTYRMNDQQYTVTIVGDDESNPSQGKVSYRSPLASVFLKKRQGDFVYLTLPNDVEVEIEIINFTY